MADEVRLFGRLSLYALVVGTIYWFVSYEVAGTVPAARASGWRPGSRS